MKTNMVLTVVEVTGLVIIVLIGAWVLGSGDGDFGRNFEFKQGETALLAILAGTALAFYELIGFEDSANVAEEARDPARSFPLALFAGIVIDGPRLPPRDDDRLARSPDRPARRLGRAAPRSRARGFERPDAALLAIALSPSRTARSST